MPATDVISLSLDVESGVLVGEDESQAVNLTINNGSRNRRRTAILSDFLNGVMA